MVEFFDGYIEFKREMTVGEQGRLIQEDDFKKFTDKFGNERTLGYLEAMKDFNAHLEVILGGGYCRNGVAETGHMVRKYLCEFVDHNTKFLSKMKQNQSSTLKP
ncbi:hypothetical protein OQX63_17230 [Pedobacter sp. PF22-3]|uniref:hypothetical protein n=1 Tax=Pedobacter sp. PF22-3 TaxID=2994467 RepID=UPI0022454BE7|nr:hypothetical protein [Pedobacter sp. PF22-3]MCX2495236.1 hypothetical protein [Pedobacter sp. PF22-3]